MPPRWLLISLVCSAAASQCPTDYAQHPVILVSTDGFRADYLNRDLTPTLKKLAETGIHAPYLQPSYPTQTFPNHYTIVTGLYPESHGIISNKFYDPEFHATFSIGTEESKKGRWWGGDPIWNTITRQGKISATFFWPGSDVPIDDQYPTYWVEFDESIPFEYRVDKVLEWVSLPEEERPVWISLYFQEPDHTAHMTGPDSSLVNKKLQYVDQMLQRLVDGLEERELLSCVNLIILADHGMASSVDLPDYVINLKDYIPDIYDAAYTFTGAFSRIDPKNKSEEVEQDMMSKLACKREELRVYQREDLPTRLHFSNNRRIEDIVLDLDPGYVATVSSSFSNLGNHGYDYYNHEMDALFIALGPDFLHNMEIEPFHNIELYNLMCHLTGVNPSPNNGTLGSLYHILAHPPEYPQLPEEEKPTTSGFPEGDLGPLLGMSGCEGDLEFPEDWLASLNFSFEQQQELEAIHVPWGIPHSGHLPANLTLLHHPDHVTAYSEALRMPLWTSFSVESGRPGTPLKQWCSDVRLHTDTTQTCASYGVLEPLNITMHPLFAPKYSKDASLGRLPYLVSNAVPVSLSLAKHWEQLMDLLVPAWLEALGPLNLLVGPVFDNNADSFPDNFLDFSSPEVPSDLFAVITRCTEPVSSLTVCPHAKLDANSFIFPQKQLVTNCMDAEKYTHEFSAKVHDIELVTGLTLYPDTGAHNRTSLILRSHSDMWLVPSPPLL
ncbi:venom phosphodiesterase-like [Scylla paramamosain]